MRITPVITGAITETNISCHINSPPPCYTHGVIGDFIIIPSGDLQAYALLIS